MKNLTIWLRKLLIHYLLESELTLNKWRWRLMRRSTDKTKEQKTFEAEARKEWLITFFSYLLAICLFIYLMVTYDNWY